MAIVREGIIVGNNYVDQMKVMAKELATMSSDMISYLDGNANFQVFREGTERGAGIYRDLNGCVNAIVEQLVPTIDKISATTANLLNHQQNLNKAEETMNRERNFL